MRNRIFGAIGILWGGSVLVWSLFIRDWSRVGRGPYAAGSFAGVAMAAILLIAGLYFFFKANGKTK